MLIEYRNYKGEVGEYKIKPLHVWVGATLWHPTVQPLLKALKQEGGVIVERDFAIGDILKVNGLLCLGMPAEELGGKIMMTLYKKAKDKSKDGEGS